MPPPRYLRAPTRTGPRTATGNVIVAWRSGRGDRDPIAPCHPLRYLTAPAMMGDGESSTWIGRGYPEASTVLATSAAMESFL